MTTQLSVDRIIPIENLASERRSMMTLGTEIAEIQLVMNRLVDIFGIKATVVGVEDHPEYIAAQSRLLAVELAAGRVVIGGGYEEQ